MNTPLALAPVRTLTLIRGGRAVNTGIERPQKIHWLLWIDLDQQGYVATVDGATVTDIVPHDSHSEWEIKSEFVHLAKTLSLSNISSFQGLNLESKKRNQPHARLCLRLIFSAPGSEISHMVVAHVPLREITNFLKPWEDQVVLRRFTPKISKFGPRITINQVVASFKNEIAVCMLE